MGRTRENGGEGAGGGERRSLPRVSPLRKALVAASLLIALTGLGMWGYAKAAGPGGGETVARQPSAPPAGDPARSIAPQGIMPVDPGALAPEDGGAIGGQDERSAFEEWSPAVFRLGFSFFAGFCVAYALKAFMKVTFIVIGAALLGLFALQYAGLVSVDWGAMEGVYDTVAAWVGSQTGSFSRFVSGYLPSAASGVAGFAAGFTTKR